MDTLADVRPIPLAVDLDGTLIATDLLFESLFMLLRTQPLALLLMPLWLARGGVAHLKQEIARRVHLDPASLPYRSEVLEHIREAQAAGQPIVLATGAAHAFAHAIAAHLGLFDAILATTGYVNLTSRNKRHALVSSYGSAGFDYMGNSRHDLDIFGAARRSIVVAPDRATARWQACHDSRLLQTPGGSGVDILRMLRVHQWLKNLLVLVPMVLSHGYLEPRIVVQSILAFIAFSAAASSVYILNDFFDLAADRRHPTKRRRPLASGLLSMPFGLAVASGMLASSAVVATLLPPVFAATLLIYLIVTTAYSLYIKRTLLFDVLVLAGLYTIRILGGAAATGIPVSFWLLAFAVFFFLSLALVKRFAELRSTALLPGGRIAGRSYRSEDQDIIAQAGLASAFSSAIILALYIDSSQVKELYKHPWMVWPLAPIVLYLTMRIWILARRDQMHDDPIVFLIRDWRSQMMIAIGGILLVSAVFWP